MCAALLGLTPSCGPAPGPGAPPTSVATLPALSLRSRHVLADTWLGLGSSRGKLVGMPPSNLGLWPGEAVTQMAGTLSSRPSCSKATPTARSRPTPTTHRAGSSHRHFLKTNGGEGTVGSL